MGNRKARRRAALSTAGRRVKLDLFAEPSGEVGGSSANTNGGDTESKHSTGSPKLLSSDQLVKNPLLLLGQYSDDEDEESNGSPTPAVVNSSPKDLTDLVVELTNKAGVTASPDGTVAGSGNQKIATAGPNLIHRNSALDHHKVPESSELQVIGDVGSGWKMVRHDATNQCYYWNVDTGETSWEVSQLLSQTEETTTAQKLPSSSEEMSSCNPPGTSGAGLVVDGFVNPDHSTVVPESSSSALHGDYASSFGSSLGAYYSYQQSDGNVGDWNNLAMSYGMAGKGVDENLGAIDLSSRVLKFGEYLFERLQSLKGSSSESDGQNWVSRYILEVEIRLSDIRSLIPYGSALLPFWVLSERKLRQLGEAFNHEASQLVNANNIDVDCVSTFPGGSEKCKTTEKTEMKEHLHSSEILNASVATATELPEDISTHSADGIITTEKMPPELTVNDTDKINEKSSVTSDSNQDTGDDVEDDMDMDVDMEVDEPVPSPCNTTMEPVARVSSPQNLPLVSEIGPSLPQPPDEGWIPPPPSDEEMIPPPPPPDNENFLPPLSNDLPESSVQPSPYSDPYNGYSGFSYGYYDQTVAGVQGTQFQGQVAAYHVATPHGGVYYEAPNSYITNAPVIANSVEPLLYYDPHGIQVPAPPVLNGAPSVLYNVSGLENHSAVAVNETGSSCSESKVSNGVQYIEKGLLDSSLVIPTIQAQAFVSKTADVPLPATDSASVRNTTVSQGQSKAARGKKRNSCLGPSMRSNKKVSSLVDKWKAAKEELQEDEEDEPEDSYEALEKKKQREIEEWRAKQIASGEAKDNANFQPLGCDWRERVKRRRAHLSAEAPQASPDDSKIGKQEPALTKFAKNLPPGWQVHWDESSKQVYYSNVNTSVTTWIRPAQ